MTRNSFVVLSLSVLGMLSIGGAALAQGEEGGPGGLPGQVVREITLNEAEVRSTGRIYGASQIKGQPGDAVTTVKLIVDGNEVATLGVNVILVTNHPLWNWNALTANNNYTAGAHMVCAKAVLTDAGGLQHVVESASPGLSI